MEINNIKIMSLIKRRKRSLFLRLHNFIAIVRKCAPRKKLILLFIQNLSTDKAQSITRNIIEKQFFITK